MSQQMNRNAKPLSELWRELVEGKVKLALLGQPRVGQDVFYNPEMSLNRDLAILFAGSHFPLTRSLRICDPMTASGVRAARYVLECPNFGSVIAADSQPEAVALASSTIQLNGLADRISVVESDANLLLLNHMKDRFDIVDLDPFGSPAPFFECALRATVDGGVVAATATDMAPLTGARPRACVRKYGISPVRTEFGKEMAIRILSANLTICAGKLGLGIDLVFSHASDHYARIFAQVMKGRAAANQAARSLGFLEYCSRCLMRIERKSIDAIRGQCETCGARTKVGGPIWLSQLWRERTVANMVDRTPTLSSSRLTEVQNILASIWNEQKAPAFHYRVDVLAKTLRLKPPPMSKVLTALHEAGFEASRTHFHPNGFRTNAPQNELTSSFKALSRNET